MATANMWPCDMIFQDGEKGRTEGIEDMYRFNIFLEYTNILILFAFQHIKNH